MGAARGDAPRRRVADRAAAGRSEARALEDELAGGVVELQSRASAPVASAATATAAGPVVCPYKGLASFDAEDAGYFFGRERLVAELVARLVGAPLLGGRRAVGQRQVVGGPGRAAAGAGRRRPAGQRPVGAGAHASRRAAAARAAPRRRAGSPASGTACSWSTSSRSCSPPAGTSTSAREFIDALVRAAGERDGRGVVVLAVRADFYGRCAAYPALSRLLGANHVLVGPMRATSCGARSSGRRERVGLSVEPELVDALVADVEGEPGALPLLSTALLELWRERDRRRLRLAAYVRSGGVAGRRRAAGRGRVRAPRRRPQQAAARTLLLRLADEGESGAVVRRRVALAELERGGRRGRRAGSPTAACSRSARATVEVAHEALLREWPRLRGWLEEDAQGRRLHRRLSDAARDWDADGRDPGELYRGARLASALDWAADHELELNATERAFLDDSRRASGRAQRRLRAVLAGVAALLVLAVIAGVVALDQRGNARAQATAADAQRLGAQALAEDDLDRSLLLARQGVALDDSPQTRGNLLAALLRSPAAIGVLRGDGDRLHQPRSQPRRADAGASSTTTGRLSFVDTRTRRPVARPLTVSGVADLPQAVGWTRALQPRRHPARGRRRPAGRDGRAHASRAHPAAQRRRPGSSTRLRFSPDGRTLFAVVACPAGRRAPASSASTRAPAGALGAERAVASRARRSSTLMVTRDGRRVVTTLRGGPTMIRDARTLRPLKRLPVGAEQAALSPDDRTLLRRRPRRLGALPRPRHRHGPHRLRTPRRRGGARDLQRRRAHGRHRRRGQPRDRLGRRAGGGRRDARGPRRADHRPGDQPRRPDALHAPALDGKVMIWDLAGAHRLGRPFGIGPTQRPRAARLRVPATRCSPDGRVLAVGHGDGTVEPDRRPRRCGRSRRSARSRTDRSAAWRTRRAAGCSSSAATTDSSRSSTRAAASSSTTAARLTSGPRAHAQLQRRRTAHGDRELREAHPAVDAAVGPSRSARPLRSSRRRLGDVSLSPDGRTLAVAAAGTGRRDHRRRHAAAPRAAAGESETVSLVRFTPDGRYVVGGSAKGWARLWSTKTWRPAARVLAGHTGRVIGQSVSPDGRHPRHAAAPTAASGCTTCPPSSRSARRCPACPTARSPRSSRPTAPTCSPSPTPGAPTAGTYGRRRGRATPAPWPGERSPEPNGSDALPGRQYAPACTR